VVRAAVKQQSSGAASGSIGRARNAAATASLQKQGSPEYRRFSARDFVESDRRPTASRSEREARRFIPIVRGKIQSSRFNVSRSKFKVQSSKFKVEGSNAASGTSTLNLKL
jgi:hypothetical protein